jgi:hypothetical protein
MKTTIFLQSLFLFPLIGLAVIARSAWVKILAFMAGLGMSSACNAESAKPSAETGDPEAMVECYKQVAVTETTMKDSRWAHSDLITDWATAERAVLSIAVKGSIVYDELQLKITAARQAATAASAVVDTKLLSQAAYEMAVKVMDEWHADIALSSGSVKCYKRMAPPPAVSDTSSRLYSLQKLQAQGKIDDKVLAQAKDGMKSSLAASLTSKQSAELADFLLDLLGYAQ